MRFVWGIGITLETQFQSLRRMADAPLPRPLTVQEAVRHEENMSSPTATNLSIRQDIYVHTSADKNVHQIDERESRPIGQHELGTRSSPPICRIGAR
jgi:hypothetical protein